MGKLTSAIKAGQAAIEMTNNVRTLHSAASTIRSADKSEMGRRAGHHAFNEGAEVGKTVGKSWLKTFEVIPRLVCRALQLVMAIVACGFYGNRVHAEDRADEGFSAEWIFAILVGGLAATTAILFLLASPISAIPVIGSKLKLTKTYRLFPWDASLFLLWIIVFGIFAGIFLKRDSDEPYKGSNVTAMKTAVWVDLVNAILWLVSAVYGGIKRCLGDKVDRLSDKAGNKLFDNRGRENYAEV